jgi:hypothetical protein
MASFAANATAFLNENLKDEAVLTTVLPKVMLVSSRVDVIAGELGIGVAAIATELIVVAKVRATALAAVAFPGLVMPVAIVTVHVLAAASVAVPAVRVRVVPDLVAGKVVVPQPEE